MVSWFLTVKEEEVLTVYEAAVLTNTHKENCKIWIGSIYMNGFIILSREVIGETDTKRFVSSQ